MSPSHRLPTEDPLWVRILLVVSTLVILSLLLLVPLSLVFAEAFRKGVELFYQAIVDPAAWHAIKLTILTAAIVVPLNTLFGLAAAWLVTKHEFKGKGALITLIDIPFAVSPVVAGLALVLLFGSSGWVEPMLLKGIGATLGDQSWLYQKVDDIKIVFAVPGIVIATCFITFPFVARELIPLMEARGNDEELAALTLGASGWRTFFRITLPNVKWALFYGIILCNARSMGEFGAVSVVSGHIREQTNTVPLHIEILYNEYQFSGAFAVSTLLVFLALLTIVLKATLEFIINRRETAH